MKLATFASSILATSFFTLAGAAVPAVAFASPNDGVQCRSGYSGALSGTRFICSKARQINVALECVNRLFPTKVIRAPGAPGDTSGGRDLCTRAGINIGTTDSLNGLVQGQDFIFAAVNQTTVNAQITSNDQSEAQALSLGVADVDTAGSAPTVVVNGGFGSNDVARVTLTFNTFPVPALGLIQLPPGGILPNLPTVPNLPRLP